MQTKDREDSPSWPFLRLCGCSASLLHSLVTKRHSQPHHPHGSVPISPSGPLPHHFHRLPNTRALQSIPLKLLRHPQSASSLHRQEEPPMRDMEVRSRSLPDRPLLLPAHQSAMVGQVQAQLLSNQHLHEGKSGLRHFGRQRPRKEVQASFVPAREVLRVLMCVCFLCSD